MQPNVFFTAQETEEGEIFLQPDQTQPSEQQTAQDSPVLAVRLTPALARLTCVLAAVQTLGGMVTRSSVQLGDRVTLRLPPTVTAGKAVFLVLRATDLITTRQSKPYRLTLPQ